MGGPLLAAGLAPTWTQEGTNVAIVLNEEVDVLEPCMATRSTIGRVILGNVNETLTELDVRGDGGLLPRLA